MHQSAEDDRPDQHHREGDKNHHTDVMIGTMRRPEKKASALSARYREAVIQFGGDHATQDADKLVFDLAEGRRN